MFRSEKKPGRKEDLSFGLKKKDINGKKDVRGRKFVSNDLSDADDEMKSRTLAVAEVPLVHAVQVVSDRPPLFLFLLINPRSSW